LKNHVLYFSYFLFGNWADFDFNILKIKIGYQFFFTFTISLSKVCIQDVRTDFFV